MALENLRQPPSNRLELLRCKFAGYHSIRINKQWRIIFRWEGQDAHECKSPTTIETMKQETAGIPLTNSAAAMLRDFLDDHSLSQAKLAAALHISPQLLNDILASRRLLTPEHCLKLGRYFGNEPEYWMRLQNHYLFRKTQREKADELCAVVPLQAAS